MITNENYFSAENNMKYMSTSQYKEFRKCPARALAKLRGEWEEEKTTALLIGSYVDASFEGSLDLFCAQNPEIFLKGKPELKSEYRYAEYIIQRIERDPLFMLLMSGKKQIIKTGEIAGVPYKIKIDSYLDADTCRKIVELYPQTSDIFGFCDGAIVDMKIMKDFEPIWDDDLGMKVSFAEYWGYDLQGAAYQEIEGNALPFIIVAATKEKPEPNLQAFFIPQQELDAKLMEMKQDIKHYADLKLGIGEPEHCGHCPYCRSKKVLNEIIDYREVM